MIRINLLPREEKAHHDVNISMPKVGELLTAWEIGMARCVGAAVRGR